MGDEVTEKMARGMGEASLNTTQLQQEVADDDWESILESIGDGFWVFDRSWCCTYINNRQAFLVGMPKENVRGKNVWELFPDLVDTEFYRQLHRAVAEQTPIHFEYFCATWQGWFEIRVYPSAKGVSILMLAITKRKQTQELLRETEQRFQAFMNHSPTSAWIADQEGQLLYLNPTYFRMFQFQKQDAVGKNILDIYPAEFAQEFLENNQRVFATGRVIETIETAPQPDGSVGEFLVYKFPIRSGSGEMLLGGIAVDITERRRVEEALRASEQQLKIALQTAKLGSWQMDLATNTLTCSEQCQANFGLPPEAEFSHQTLFAALHPEDCDRVQAAIQRSVEERTDYEIEERCFWPDGSLHWLIARGGLIYDSDGIPIRMVGVTLDITERKQAEEELRLSEERFRLATRAVAGLVYDWDVQTGTVYRSEGLYQLIGVHPEDVPETRNWWIERIHPDDRADIQSVMNVILAGNAECYDYEYRVRHQNGRWIDVWDRGYLIRDRNGHLIRVVGSSTDISDRKQAEEALRESNERLNLALAAAYMGDWSWDAATDLVTFSERAAAIFGIVPGSYMTWTKMRELLHEQDRDRARLEVERAVLEHSDYDIEYRVIRPDGVHCWVAAKGRAQYDGSGQVLRMIGVVQDITERKHAEQALQESEAMATARAQELEALMQITPAALWIADDPNCHHMSANQTAYDLMRATPGSVATATPADGSYLLQFKQRRNGQEVAPHDLPMQRAARTGQEVIDELEFAFEDGTVRFIYGKAVPLRNEAGSIRGVIGAFVDVTQRKQAEREREQLLARERAARE
ncbi:MAG TPA: PAS domain S-box protein, partial [Waterburya sp.]